MEGVQSDDAPLEREAIAVVGMAMRFPGDAHCSDSFWRLLSEGKDGWKPFPKSRYDIDGYYHPDSARAGSIWLKGSHFLSGEYEKSVQVFDAPFFNMTTTEVNGTDPQQFHMLEVSYEALENAGIPMQSVAGSDTSVYVGCFTRDFEAKGGRDPYTGPFYAATGNGQSMLSNRVSWFYDMRGPSMTVDTACSSSLYAVHLACQALHTGESKMAIAGGTNLIADPSYMRDLTTMGFLSPDGRCHSFDHRANGYARGDGIAAVVLKTVSQALKDGDCIRGIIRGSGLGQDGRTPGITMPSPDAQADLIRSVYRKSGLSLDRTGYFEAHGTGTPIGDPYELSALGASFGKTRDSNNPLYVGSVKTNVGHLEGCAGLAGLIKSILVVERGQIPPLADFQAPNPRLKLEEWKVALPTELMPWPTEGLRRASVNCFGYGGANSHVVVDDAHHFLLEHGLKGTHQTLQSATETPCLSDTDSAFGSMASTPGDVGLKTLSQRPSLLVVSSADASGIQRNARALASYLEPATATTSEEQEHHKGLSDSCMLSDLAYTFSLRRSALDHRSFVIARSIEDVATELLKPMPKIRRNAKNTNLFFVMTGQGAQWPGMGQQLLSFAPFRHSLERAQRLLYSIGCEWSIVKEMSASKDTSRIDDPKLSQPLCTALQLALIDLLADWNVLPKAVVGHSSGEIAAAYAAGYITHEDAMQVAYWRGVYSSDVNNRLAGKRGTMMAVGLSEEDVKPYLETNASQGTVVVACVNSPQSVTVAGDEDGVSAAEKLLQDDGIFARRLRVKTAYHSPHMKTIAADYYDSISKLQPRPSETGVTMFSSVTGKAVDPLELDAHYWVRNMLNTVRFADAVKSLLVQPAFPNAKGARRKVAVAYSGMVEVGPAEALKGPLTQIINAHNSRLSATLTYVAPLSRNSNAEDSALAAAGKLWAHGLPVDLERINFPVPLVEPPRALGCLPPYRWNHSKIYHHESAWGKKYQKRPRPRTDLLGMRLENANEAEPRWHNYIRLSEQPWMSDHRVQQMTVYPGAAMAVQAIEAALELAVEGRTLRAIEVRNISFKRGVLLPAGDGFVETAIHLKPSPPSCEDETCYAFIIFAQGADEPWHEVSTGVVASMYEHDDFGERTKAWAQDTALYREIQRRCARQIPAQAFYKMFDQKMNLQYGPLHRNVTECFAGFGEGYGTVTVPDTKKVMPANFEYPHLIHPATLDSVFHMQALGYLHSLSGEESLVPISIEKIYVDAGIATDPGTTLHGYSKGLQSQSGDTIGDIVLSDAPLSGPKVIVRGFLSRDLSATSRTVQSSSDDDTRPRKCTSMRYVPLFDPLAPEDVESIDFSPSNTNAGDAGETQLVNDAATVATKLTEVVIVHNRNAHPGIDTRSELLRAKLAGDAETISVLRLADVTFGEQSNVAGKIVIALVELEESFVFGWSETNFALFRSLVGAAECILWVTRGADAADESSLEQSVTLGLLRTVRVERPQLRLFQLDLTPKTVDAAAHDVELILDAFHSSVLARSTAVDPEFVEIDGRLHVPRLFTDDSFHAELDAQGQLSPTVEEVGCLEQAVAAKVLPDSKTLCFARVSHDELAPNEVAIMPEMVILDSHAFSGQSAPGRDALGVVKAVGSAVSHVVVGDRVVACAAHAMQFPLLVDGELVEVIPAFVNPAASVTMPTALTMAQIALVELGRLQPNESVLISAALDAVGLALIQLAMALDARVFATFETQQERDLLLGHVGMDEKYIVKISRDADFNRKLRQRNGGRGVDVLVNSIPGDVSYQSTGCLESFGRCVNIGSTQHIASAASLDRGVSISNLDFEHLRAIAPARVVKAFRAVWALAKQGIFHSMLPKRPLKLSMITDIDSLPNAVMSPGGAVISIQPHSQIRLLPPPPPALSLDAEATYVLAGGLGGIGRSIAETLFLAGARHIIFVSRSGAKTDEAKRLIASLEYRGCVAKALSLDITSAKAVESFVKASSARGEKIKGVIQCAMALHDSTFDTMTFNQWTDSLRPKVEGSWNLHRFLPDDMDFFVMLSSMAGVIGNPGQANYSAAGTYQDALSVHRRAHGLPSITIDLGIVSDVGYIAENPEQFERLNYLRPLFISERDLRLLLSAAMLNTTRDGHRVPAQITTGVGSLLMQDGSIGGAMDVDLKYSELHAGAGAQAGDSSDDEAAQEALKAATTVGAACEVVEAMFCNQIAKACSMEADDVDLEKPMHAYGVDSLAAIEVRNMIFRKVKADISVFDVLSAMSMRKMAIKVVAKSTLVRNAVQTAASEENLE